MRGVEYGLERKTCDCELCKINCCFMPGCLSPLDLRRMQEWDAVPENLPDQLKWAETRLLASPGGLAVKSGRLFRIPTLVPATKANGTCIHFTNEEKCAIHPVAPFGCAYFDHNSGPATTRDIYEYMAAVCDEWWHRPDGIYCQTWVHLHFKGLIQQSPEVLRERMATVLQNPGEALAHAIRGQEPAAD